MVPASFEVATSPELVACVERGANAAASPVADALVARLSRELAEALVCVVFYGSRLNQTAGPRSDWDFIVVVESYRAAHRSWLHARLNSVLPPSVYRREVTLGDGSSAFCKISFVSARDLDRYTSSSAPDSYLFGRLSKRVALVFTRDDRARRRIIDSLARSVALCAGWVLAEAAEALGVEVVAQEGVGFSYRCEERVESASRPLMLFESDAAYFREAYECAVAAQVASGGASIDADGLVERSGPDPARLAERAAAAAFVRRCRRRARVRWLKNIATFDGWVDYMLTKIERHQDAGISLSDRERRHPLLAAVRHYVRLRRAGRLSGPGRARADGSAG